MEKTDILKKIVKIFRANTIEVDVVIGQYGQTQKEKQIENIQELETEIIDLISDQYKKGQIDKKDIFIGTGKLGSSYSVSEAIEVAKKWGFKYVAWNDGEILKFDCTRIGLKYDEL